MLEDVQRRLDENSQAMRTCRETVEYPFVTIKARMGATHFLMKRLKNGVWGFGRVIWCACSIMAGPISDRTRQRVSAS